jgi:hypothetical protein
VSAGQFGNPALADRLNDLSTALTSLVQNSTSAVYQSQVQASLTPLRTRSPHLVSPTGPPVYEDYTNEVEALYQTVLGRAADPGGLRSGVAFLVGGGTVEQLGVMIAGSREYAARSGGRHEERRRFLPKPVYCCRQPRPLDNLEPFWLTNRPGSRTLRQLPVRG